MAVKRRDAREELSDAPGRKQKEKSESKEEQERHH